MPPGQPIRRCAGDDCGLYRPCRTYGGVPLCVECSPETIPVDGAGNTLAGQLAADGGDRE